MFAMLPLPPVGVREPSPPVLPQDGAPRQAKASAATSSPRRLDMAQVMQGSREEINAQGRSAVFEAEAGAFGHLSKR